MRDQETNPSQACHRRDANLEDIIKERSKIYGDPRENHRAIAMCWAGLLAPHAESIASMEPLPEHVIALMMTVFKVCRMRICYHEDNYDDARVYMGFAQAWQRP